MARPGWRVRSSRTIRAACSSPECSPATISTSTRPPAGGGRNEKVLALIDMITRIDSGINHEIPSHETKRSERDMGGVASPFKNGTPTRFPWYGNLSRICYKILRSSSCVHFPQRLEHR